ncbi:hypothetical protein [Tropicibacter naphthalenivorans]|uniref:Uncharacterized protein n=1 Tax=Tropicibacter naphthalenivorans TaxID=441103 RepID=A0A0N7M044_9RHOB|nr:hypothetical protein [Tropicibacter naphthalenivorans]CUH79433.1 hypothetical protein TRN7648_02468 [Tropicibacter naphthalenivorans]SMC72209.1 hypothetical protein SAMN04488093_10398 [Tropicibacter naphthalenivorans]
MIVHFDKFETWEASFSDLVVRLLGEEVTQNLASSKFEYIDDAGDFLVRHSDIESVSTEIHSWILAHEFCSFHGTRLLPEEIFSVQNTGLHPLVASDREQRLRRILAHHPRWNSIQHMLLEVLDDVGPKEKQGRRQGQVHSSLSRSGLVNGFDHYLTHGSEFDQHVVRRLFDDQSGLELLSSQTVPVLVHVHFSGEQLIQGAHPFFGYLDVVGMGEIPGIARTFLDAWAFKIANPKFDLEKLRTDCCLMERFATQPERILEIEKLGDINAQ